MLPEWISRYIKCCTSLDGSSNLAILLLTLLLMPSSPVLVKRGMMPDSTAYEVEISRYSAKRPNGQGAKAREMVVGSSRCKGKILSMCQRKRR